MPPPSERHPGRGPAFALSRGPSERAAAWAVTGPLGHLGAAVAEIVALWGRFALHRLRTRGR